MTTDHIEQDIRICQEELKSDSPAGNSAHTELRGGNISDDLTSSGTSDKTNESGTDNDIVCGTQSLEHVQCVRDSILHGQSERRGFDTRIGNEELRSEQSVDAHFADKLQVCEPSTTNKAFSNGCQASTCTEPTTETDNQSEPVAFKIRTIGGDQSHVGYSLVLGIEVEGVKLEAVIDCGAQVTVLKRKWMESWLSEVALSENVNLKGAAEHGNMQASKAESVSIELGGSKVHLPVYVADISDDCILGLDWIRANKVTIDFEHGVVFLPSRTIVAHYKQGRAGLVPLLEARVIQKTQLQPNEVQCIDVEAASLRDGCWLLQDCQLTQRVMIPNILMHRDKQCIWVMNNSSNHVTLPVGHLIGVLQPVDMLEEQLCSRREVRRIGSSVGSNEVPVHLEHLCQASSEGLKPDEIDVLRELLIEHNEAFSKGDDDLGHFSAIQHNIDTGDAIPIKQRMRRTPLGYAEEEKEHLDKLLDAKVIEPSESEWASPSVLVRKKDGSVRWCIDMRKLNNVTVKDRFPLPLIEECVDALGGCKYFSTLDMASGYYQLKVSEEDRPKTAFVTKYGLFQFQRMPFGLCNAPATFCRAMALVLRGLSWSTVIAFLDDVIVLGKSFEEHANNLKEVLGRFRGYGMKLKPKKCELFRSSVLFVGKVVSQDGVSVNPANVEKVKNWKQPSTRKEVEAFLGLVNYHREHIVGYAGIARPLYELTKNVPFYWKEEQQHAFDQLKEAMTSTPVLAYPNSTDAFILDTDASNHSIGAELLQVQGGKERVIGYDSLVLSKSQRRYCTTRKELLAVIMFTRHFRHYLLGKPFHLRTDHNSLVWLLGFKNIEGQLARWLEELATYDMTILHRPGKDHGNADGLSRIPSRSSCDCPSRPIEVENLPCAEGDQVCSYCSKAQERWERFKEDVDYVVPLSVREIQAPVTAPLAIDTNATVTGKDKVETWLTEYSFEDIGRMQAEDPDLKDILEWTSQQKQPLEHEVAILSPAAKSWWILRKQLNIVRGVLYHEEEAKKVLIAPRKLQKFLLENCHDAPGCGHMGILKTLARLKNYATWHRMGRDVLQYVKSCATCNRQKNGAPKARASQRSYHVGSPMERVHIDVLGPITETPRGNRFVLVMVDQFTKWVECCAMPNQTAETVARCLVDNIVARLGCPLELHSDQGRNFESRIFQEMCTMLEISRTRTTPYRPQANGQVERFNRTILQILRCFMVDHYTDWDIFMPLVASAIGSTVNRSTGFTPNYLMLGREVMQPLDLMLARISENKDGVDNTVDYVKQYQEAFQKAHEIARETLKQSQIRQKRDYDTRTKYRKYNVGDIVLRIRDAGVIGISRKLQAPWSGPWIVQEVINPALFKIRNRTKSTVVHHDKLKLCTDRNFPIWLLRLRQDIMGNQIVDGEADPQEELVQTQSVEKNNEPELEWDLRSFWNSVEGTVTDENCPEDIEGSESTGVDDILFEEDEDGSEVTKESEQLVSRSGRPLRKPEHLNEYYMK